MSMCILGFAATRFLHVAGIRAGAQMEFFNWGGPSCQMNPTPFVILCNIYVHISNVYCSFSIGLLKCNTEVTKVRTILQSPDPVGGSGGMLPRKKIS